jgi:tetratricopeptide (TPR) repeat protein
VLGGTVLLALGGCTSSTGRTGSNGRLSDAAKSNPSLYAFSLQREGSGFFQQARYEEALTRFEEAERLQPGNSTVSNMIGLCKLKLGRPAEALESFSRALTITPSFTDARNNRGAAYLALGQFRLAEIDFVAVLADSTYPHRWQVYYNLGMTYLQQGKLSAAIENFERAATGGQPVFDAFLRLSEAALEQGRNDVAVDWLERARLEFPDRVEASLRLGTLLVQLDRGDEARRHLEDVIAASPSSEMADEARAQMARIGHGSSGS